MCTKKMFLTESVNLYLQSVAPFYSSFVIFNPMVTQETPAAVPLLSSRWQLFVEHVSECLY